MADPDDHRPGIGALRVETRRLAERLFCRTLGDITGARAALDEATAANPADFTLISLGSLVEEPGDLE
ncbi:MAG: hypothetical protein AAF501_18875 [Pseudomonadota bacterium]